jgi:hypothetical protein
MSIKLVPKFIKASNERQAMLKMYAYQLKFKKQCNVINIYRDAKDGLITLWFYDEILNSEIMKNADKS